MLARLSAFGVWALAAGSVVFWALRLGAQPQPAPGHALPVDAEGGRSAAVVRMLGGPPPVAQEGAAPPPVHGLASRFQLIGVVAPREGSRGPGVALISVDGKPGKPVALGAPVDGDLVLQALTHRTAAIGPQGAPAAVTLELPLVPPPRTGSLPASGGGAPATIPPPAVPAVAPPGVVAPAGVPGPRRPAPPQPR